MIEYLKLENFRGFKEIELLDMKPITLISGKNNSGKSSILEGIFLNLDHVAYDSFIKLNNFRGYFPVREPLTLWEPLFYDLDISNSIKIETISDGVKTELEYTTNDSFAPIFSDYMSQDLRWKFTSASKASYSLEFMYSQRKYSEKGNFLINQDGIIMKEINTSSPNNLIEIMPIAQYINSVLVKNDNVVVEWVGKAELDGKKQEIIDALKIIEPYFEDITTISNKGITQLYGKNSGKLLPLKLLGDGINQLLFILLSIIANPNSVILIDEIETGFHYSVYDKMWEAITTTAKKYGCQVIATTHSYECINSAINGIKNSNREEDFCFYRIDKSEEKTVAYRDSYGQLAKAIESDLEVR